MNKTDCNIIRDLLPLYIDEVCSSQSRQLVEEHLKECESCRRELEQMKSDMPLESPMGADNPQNTLMRIRKAIKAKYVIIALCAVIIGGGLFAGYAVMNLIESPMYYEEIDLKAVQDKNDPEQYNLIMNGPDYHCYYGEFVTLKETKKYRYLAAVIHFTSTPWTRTFGKKSLDNMCVSGFKSDPDCTDPDSYTQNEDGSKQYDKTVAAYYQATPGSERHLLWEADWYKEMLEKEKVAGKVKAEKSKQK